MMKSRGGLKNMMECNDSTAISNKMQNLVYVYFEDGIDSRVSSLIKNNIMNQIRVAFNKRAWMDMGRLVVLQLKEDIRKEIYK